MANTILITANWHTGALSQQTISRQYDNNRYVVQFVGYPEASEGNELDYYLLVWMSSAPGETPDEIAPIQLASDQWYISNVFTQQTQQIKFQMCALNTEGTFEAHSPIFTGFVRNSLDHDGTTQDIDVSTLFDAYREYLNELIIRAGAVVIDPTLTQSGQAADAKEVGDKIEGVKNLVSDKFTTIYSKNRFDPTNIENGYVNQATGAWVAGSTSYKGTSDMIDVLGTPFVVAFRRYAGTVNIVFRYAVYDANGDYITGAIVPKEDFTIVDDYTDSHQKVGYLVFNDSRIKYIRFSISAGYFATLDVLIAQGTTPPAYAPYSGDTNTAKGLQIINRSVVGAKGVKMRYASVPINATMRIGIENSLKKNKIYHLHTLINSSFSSLLFGHGEGAYSLYFSIDSTNIVFMTNGTAGTTLAHGLTLDTYIDFMLIVGERNTGTIILNTLGGTYSHTVQIVQGYKGDVFIRAVGAALGETTIVFSSKDFRQPIWMFGDSYFTHTSNARWTYWLLEWGFGRCLLNGFPGANSDEALPQVVNYLGTWGIPKYIVWCLRMNDPDDGAINSTWLDCVTELIAQCSEYGAEPILATIPNVPSLDHTYKNAWVRESGYRYIDFAKAVGAESAGSSWYTGALSSDNTHPSEIGARLLCQQALLDVPELTM